MLFIVLHCLTKDHLLLKKRNHGTEEPCMFLLSSTMTNDPFFTLKFVVLNGPFC